MRLDIIYNQDCLEGMRKLLNDSIDQVVTDPPYGISFMGKHWDQALPSVDIWRECLRVLKPGAFAFVMCIPRQDCLARMVVSLEDAGFVVGFSPMFHTFASGFPKASNIGKAVDKRLGVKREVMGVKRNPYTQTGSMENDYGEYAKQTGKDGYRITEITAPATPQAQALDGSYSGFQPKPAVEIILVAMKSLSEKTYVDQALKNGKGVTWLDSARIPFSKNDDSRVGKGYSHKASPEFGVADDTDNSKGNKVLLHKDKGRFPANLLASDDALNDGRVLRGGDPVKNNRNHNWCGGFQEHNGINDSGSFSRYFSLDAWWKKKLSELPIGVQKTFPFLIVPKASRAEKQRGCEGLEEKQVRRLSGGKYAHNSGSLNSDKAGARIRNAHPTCKPIKLMSYLITLGSRPGDVVLDPFLGSGTTAIAARMLRRHYIGYETESDYCRIAEARLKAVQERLI